MKTLGVVWNTETDGLEIATYIDLNTQPQTKREMLGEIAALYDPLGLICPVVIKAKILMQQLWLQKIEWDDVLAENIKNEWMKMKKEMCAIQNMEIPRWIGVTDNKNSELHGFCDSSELAYAAVVYVQSENGMKLLIAKTKVAPIKKLTIPRLELCGAYLLSKLIKQVLNNSETKFKKITLWTDSRIVLAWIKGNPKRWTTFVMNKVVKINENTNKENWKYVPTKHNPADCASRGFYASELLNHELWWNGPNMNEIQSDQDLFTCETQEEVKSNTVHIAIQSESFIPDSDAYYKLKLVFAYTFHKQLQKSN